MRFFEICTKIWNVFALSILWVLWCIPIVTAGAATTAYYYVLGRLVWDKEGYIIRNFFESFKRNFKISTKAWLITIVAFIVCVFNVSVMWNYIMNEGGFYFYIFPAYCVMLLLLWFTVIYVFPYIATFEDSLITTIKNSFLIAMRHLGYTLLMVLIEAALLFVGTGPLPVMLMFTPAIIGYSHAWILDRVFRRYKE